VLEFSLVRIAPPILHPVIRATRNEFSKPSKEELFFRKSEVVLLAVRPKFLFLHDRASGHCEGDFRQWLRATYRGKWSGRKRPFAYFSFQVQKISTVQNKLQQLYFTE
jgi:hypothetical protein